MADRLCVDCGGVANTWDDPDDPCPSRCTDCMDIRIAEVVHAAEARLQAIPHATTADLVRELRRECDELIEKVGMRPHFAHLFVAQAAMAAAGIMTVGAPVPWQE